MSTGCMVDPRAQDLVLVIHLSLVCGRKRAHVSLRVLIVCVVPHPPHLYLVIPSSMVRYLNIYESISYLCVQVYIWRYAYCTWYIGRVDKQYCGMHAWVIVCVCVCVCVCSRNGQLTPMMSPWLLQLSLSGHTMEGDVLWLTPSFNPTQDKPKQDTDWIQPPTLSRSLA